MSGPYGQCTPRAYLVEIQRVHQDPGRRHIARIGRSHSTHGRVQVVWARRASLQQPLLQRNRFVVCAARQRVVDVLGDRDPVSGAIAREAALRSLVVGRHVNLRLHGGRRGPSCEDGGRVTDAEERAADTGIRTANPYPGRLRRVERGGRCVGHRQMNPSQLEGVGEVDYVLESLLRGKELPLRGSRIFLRPE